MDCVENRLKTYILWQKKMCNFRKIAEAGFYYIAKLDISKCYYCNLKIKTWYPDSEPFITHMVYNQKCSIFKKKNPIKRLKKK
ncbi:hypothetical protein MYSEV_017 [Mythimna separata entomopoxvirus 'L']|uniref:Uncharacterized protein n=1 Tax=Mythimna separata entomopoxvirus 'L' TaxID=1293572 RepID=A0A916P1K9_9POXV|nr:hypothetical protein MYSEV_017 [Mythimna separata entomopoxvirus 'L']CCU56215.1 hypothetical protein MYSEV_017 [Mythimna separata entomopoxvirus 'L']